MNGVLVIDKPPGPTSHDVVARVRRVIGLRRIGHTGTLDPLATGVLPLVLGRATRLASLLSATAKEYLANVRFGAATLTYDAEGVSDTPAEPADLTSELVERALAQFHGTHWQVPPVYSAKKIEGVAAYKRARASEPVTPRPVSVTVHAIELEDYAAGLAQVRLTASAGFYVRSFAHELGQQLGCGAYLEGLRRSRAGDFTLADAIPLETIEREGPDAVTRLIPLERLLLHLPGVVLTERGARRASHGNALTTEDITALPAEAATVALRHLTELGAGPDAGERGQAKGGPELPRGTGRLRLLDRSGALLAIAEPRENGVLHPVIVLV